jgi:hypothetical protein
MVIWTRWGILGLLIPTALIVIAMIGAEALAMQRMQGEDRKPAKQAQVANGVEETPAEEDPEEAKAAERKRADDERKRAGEQGKATKRTEDIGYLIGGLASAAILWPLGRWMNKGEIGGGHTMFFIPLEYWGFIWAAIGLFKFLG